MTIVGKVTARRLVFRDGVETLLAPMGYVRSGSTNWVKSERELEHVIPFPSRYGRYLLQWGVVAPEVTPIVFGQAGKRGDVAWSLLTGHASVVQQPPAIGGFELADQADSGEVARIAEAAAADAKAAAEWLSAIRTRRDLREFLMLNRDSNDPRGFIVPSSFILKLFTAAALAVVDRDPASKQLLEETERAFAPWTDKQSQAQLIRLHEAASRSG
jgi:hypothetical protein